MLVLAVDTSSAQVSAAVVDVGVDGSTVELSARDVVAANRHGELLAQALHDVMAEAGVQPDEVAAVAAGIGPGPFTGLRIGVMTALAFADGLGLPAYGSCSLDAIALRHRGNAPFLVCSDARRKQVYWAVHDGTGQRLDGPDLAPAVDLARRYSDRIAVAVGAGAVLYADELAPIEVRAQEPYPCAVDVARLAAPRVAARAPAERLEPLYLRRPDAVPPGAPKAVTPA